MKRAAAVKAKLLTGIVAILLGVGGGCVQTWRPYWWNFYERGLSRSSEGQLQEAAGDLETAIGEKKGATVSRPEDTRRARTYGLHFVDDYFPHRELGVVYYRMKRFADAERELLASLNQTPSAKARVYLNFVRRELLRQKPAQEDPPTLTLEAPREPYLNSDRIRLTGVAESKNRIFSIFVNGRRLFIELAEQKMEFSRDLRLKPGPNEVLVEAVDLIGMSSRKKLLLNVDMEYPGIAIEDAVRKGPQTVALSGVVTDNVGISELVVEGRRQPLGRPSAEIDFSLDAALGDTISVKVTDLAGNTTSAELNISPDLLQPAGEESQRPVLLAMLGSGPVVDSGGIGLRLSQAATTRDRTPPVIFLPKDADGRVIYEDQFIFTGKARDNGRLAVLSVNGEDKLGRRTGCLVRSFTHRAYLAEGPNRFTVVAVDRAGNRAEKSFQVIRKIQEPLQNKARLALALLPLRKIPEFAASNPDSAASTVDSLLLHSFLESERFHFVERTEAYFKKIITELKIANSDLADPRTALRIGKIRTAEGFLFGRITETVRSVTVYLSLVDTETSEILFDADVYGEEGKNRDDLEYLVDGLVLKFRLRFPLVIGRVTGVTDSGVFIDKGLREGIRTGTKYLMLKEDREGRSGGLMTVKVNGKALEARVGTVQQQTCFAAFSDKTAPPVVNVNDPVITK